MLEFLANSWMWLIALPVGLGGLWYAAKSGSLTPNNAKPLLSFPLPGFLGGDGVKQMQITSSDVFWSLLPMSLYALHQVEEHFISFKGERFAFRRFFCDNWFHSEKHPELKYSINDCPLTPWMIFGVNVLGVMINYIAAFLFDVYWRGLTYRPNVVKKTVTKVDGVPVNVTEEVMPASHGINSNIVLPTTGYWGGISRTNPYVRIASLAGKFGMGVMFINSFIHIVPWMRTRAYNPGLVTSIVLFVPYCVVALQSLQSLDELFLIFPYMIFSGIAQHLFLLVMIWFRGNVGWLGTLIEKSGMVGLLGFFGVLMAIWVLRRGHTDSLRGIKKT